MGRAAVLILFAMLAFLPGSCTDQPGLWGVERGSGRRVVVTHPLDLKASRASIHLPDGRRFDGYLSFTRLLRPGQEQPPPPPRPPGLPPNARILPGPYHEELAQVFRSRGGEVMHCRFRYARPRLLTLAGGLGRCEVEDGTRVDLYW